MSVKNTRVVVIGAGIVGSSIAYHLAKRGCTDVVVLERENVEATGSTARSMACVRHQFSTEINVRFSIYSIERLKHFTEEVGGYSDLKQLGYLLLISNPATWERYKRNIEVQNSLGVRSHFITPEEAQKIVPSIRIDDLLGAAYCAEDGWCNAHGIATGYLAAARKMGVEFRRSSPAIGIQRSGDRVVSVQTPDAEIRCETVVNSAGPWAGKVGALAGLDIPVRPSRRCVYVTEPFHEIPENIPLTIDVETDFYIRKENQRILFGAGNEKEPFSENLAVDWEWFETVMKNGIRRVPVLERAGLATKNCWAGLYEVTPDHNPVLGFHPDLRNYVDASGFSGHGVMHSPATGLLIAEEILDGRATTINIDDLRITRFKNGVPQPEANVF